MASNMWAPETGKSVPSGGGAQLTVAGTKGDNLGNWLSAAYGHLQNVVGDPSRLTKVLIIAACAIGLFIFLKKRRK